MTLLTGTAIAQAIPVLISPILTRIYSPSEIGAYVIFFATSNILAIVISGRFELAILIPKKRLEGKAIMYSALFVSCVLTLVLFLLACLFRDPIANALGLSTIKTGVLLIPLTSFFLAIFQILNYWLNRNNSFKTMSFGKITQGLTMSILHVSISFLNALGLILGRLVGALVSSLYLAANSKESLAGVLRINKRVLKKVFFKYKVYPFVTMPNAVLNSTSNNLPNYLLEFFYSVRITGFYSWSVRVVQGPMGMITSSIQQVFFSKASEIFNKGGDLYSLVIKMYKKLFFIGIVPYLVLFVFAPDLFAFVFGEEWRVAGQYTVYLAPWLFLMFLNSPIVCLILLLNKQRQYFLFEILLFACRACSIYLGYFLYNEPRYSIIFYGITGLVFNIVLFFILIKISRNFSNGR